MCGTISFDVIIPTLGSSDYLKKTIESIVFDPSAIDVRVKIVLNSESLELFDKLKAEYAEREVIFSERLKNIGESWNYCTSLCTGDYFMLLHDDDILGKEYFSKMSLFLKNNKNCAIVHSAANLIDENDNVMGRTKSTYPAVMAGSRYFLEHIVSGKNSFICPSVVYNRRLIPFDLKWKENLPYTLDVEFFLRCTRYGCVGYIGNPIFNYRLHDKSTSSKFVDSYREKYKDRRVHRGYLKKEIEGRLGQEYVRYADEYYHRALSADLWFFRLSNGRVKIFQSVLFAITLLGYEKRLLLYTTYWKFFIMMFIPEFILKFLKRAIK